MWRICGVGGSGILRQKIWCCACRAKCPLLLPADCMLGALSRYISDESIVDFQPMGANMGILPAMARAGSGQDGSL